MIIDIIKIFLNRFNQRKTFIETNKKVSQLIKITSQINNLTYTMNTFKILKSKDSLS